MFVTRLTLNILNMENPNKVTGIIIKGLRERYAYTQDKLAEFLGIKREMISFYENGEREAPLDVLEKLADLFNVELSVLLSDDVNAAQAEIVFAFRKNEMELEDMKQIAKFGRVVKNYLKIVKLNERTQ
jgi:transcriptional regulator with XRE-family HTH domain